MVVACGRFESSVSSNFKIIMYKKTDKDIILEEEILMLEGMIKEVAGQLEQVQASHDKLVVVKDALQNVVSDQLDFVEKLN